MCVHINVCVCVSEWEYVCVRTSSYLVQRTDPRGSRDDTGTTRVVGPTQIHVTPNPRHDLGWVDPDLTGVLGSGHVRRSTPGGSDEMSGLGVQFSGTGTPTDPCVLDSGPRGTGGTGVYSHDLTKHVPPFHPTLSDH